MNRLSIVKRIGDLSEEHCQSCEVQAKARKERPTCKAEDYCPGCEVYTELRSLGDRLLDITNAKRKKREPEKIVKKVTAKKVKKRGRKNMARGKLEITIEEFVSLREEGKTHAEIAKLKGVALPTIKNWKTKHKEAIQRFLRQPETKTEGETAQLIKKVVEPAGERKYEVLEAAVKQLENEKAAWQKRAEKAEKELSQRDDDKEAMRQANIQLANDNKEYREEIDHLTKARITAESELDRVSEEYTKSAEALRMARDEGAFAQKRLEQQDYELENLRHSFRNLKESMEVLTKENYHLRGLTGIYLERGSV